MSKAIKRERRRRRPLRRRARPRGAYGPQGSTCPPSESGGVRALRATTSLVSGHFTASRCLFEQLPEVTAMDEEERRCTTASAYPNRPVM